MRVPPRPPTPLAGDLVHALDAAWPAPRRGLFGGSRPDRDVTPELEGVLARIALSADERWPLVLVGLARECDAPLRTRLLDAIGAFLDRMPALLWRRLDDISRPSYGVTHPLSLVPRGLTRIDAATTRGHRAWLECKSFEPIRDRFGAHTAARLLASMHPCGYVREAAVRALEGEPRAVPALLLRSGDWVEPVRQVALAHLRSLARTEHAESWVRALPLFAQVGWRWAGESLREAVDDVLRDERAKTLVLEAIRHRDPRIARAAAAEALSVFGPNDRSLRATFLAAPDTRVRLRAFDTALPPLDGDLLETALRDPFPSVRRRAIDVLGAAPRDGATAWLQEACFDRSAGVRERAIYFLEKAGAFDRPALVAEAAPRVRTQSAGVLGAVAFLCDHGGDDALPIVESLCDHRLGAVRFAVKRRLIRRLHAGAPADPRLLDDPSPRVARRLVLLLRDCGLAPGTAALWLRVEGSTSAFEARAWLATLARAGLWESLPYLVRALDDVRAPVAEFARWRVDALLRRTFRRWSDPGPAVLDLLAASLASCRDERADRVVTWVRNTAGKRDWVPGARPGR